MKIGILTFHWATNHGGILQAYALQKYLSIAIPDSDVIIIDYWPARYQKSIKRAIHSRHISAIANNFKDIKKEKILAPFRERMKKTYRYYSQKQLQNFPPQVDVLISGSDQVWNEFYTMKGEGGVTTAYFLPFQPNAKRISYAASFGFVTLKPEMEEIIKPCLEKFDAISVREQTGKAILDSIGVDSVVVCDPTLLLESNDYFELCRGQKDEKYIAKYILRAQSAETLDLISSIEKEVGVDKEITDISMVPIEEWIGAIKNAKCLVTNSFHGVVFALKFHTPFFVVGESRGLSGMNDRFNTLLDVVGLKDRFVSDVSEVKAQIKSETNWEYVDEKLSDYSETGKKYLLSNCTKPTKKKIINFYRRAECCGCGACAKSCPKGCIEMVSDSEGFMYPKIDESQCIRCGKCYDVCHIKNGSIDKKPISNTFYAKTRRENIRLASSSGGIFTELAEAVLKNGGVVFGAAFSQDRRRVEHVSVRSCAELEKLRGSKYLQSEMGDAFVEVKTLLDEKKTVLFSGTPCQIRGLKSFLKKDYDNLICIDVICHGAPSPKAWNAYLDYVSHKNKCDVSEASFRCKETGWKNSSLKLTFKNGNIKINSIGQDPFMQTFLRDKNLRPSCYDCVCKETDGVSDITLGDAWGIENYCKELDDNKGASLVFIRTQKGMKLFDSILENIDCVKSETFEESLKYNSAMCSSVSLPSDRISFFADLNNGVRFDKLARKYCKTPLLIKVKRLVKAVLKVKRKEK